MIFSSVNKNNLYICKTVIVITDVASSAGLNSFVPLSQLTTPAFPPFLSASVNVSAFMIVSKPFFHLHVYIILVIWAEDLSFPLRLSVTLQAFAAAQRHLLVGPAGSALNPNYLVEKCNLSHNLRCSSTLLWPFQILLYILSWSCEFSAVSFYSVLQPGASQECELISEQMWIFPRQATGFQVILELMTLNHVVIL